jgi:PPOX class probable F420-dependent enzyme
MPTEMQETKAREADGGNVPGTHRTEENAMDRDAALEFIRHNHHAVLGTTRSDGGVQMSPVAAGVDQDGFVVVSTRETAVKTKNLRRRPHATIAVLNDRFYGDWVQVEGPVEIVSLPAAMDGLVDYYRSLSGEHPDWDEYRAAMESERRVLLRLTVERAGPNVSG